MNQAVYPLQNPIVDSGGKPAQNAVPVVLDRVSRFLHWLQAAVSCPEIPLLQKGLCGLGGLLIEFLKIEFDVIRPAGFKVELLDRQGFKLLGLGRFQMGSVFQPNIAAALACRPV